MVRLTLEYIAEATGGSLMGAAEGVAAGVSTDSRTLAGGEAFFALRGDNHDGHDHAGDAARAGAACLVVEAGSRAEGADCPVIEVEDTLKALGDLAARVRADSGVPVVAVGGSSGKTTTKELASAILARSRTVLKTEGNYNNLIGLPLTLLRLDGGHSAAVVELGINTPGEMDRLVEIAGPTVAVMTNVGRAHLEGLGDLEGVARAKGPLFIRPGRGCVKAVNLDDNLVVRMAMAAPSGLGGAVTFTSAGRRGDADVAVVEYIHGTDLGTSRVVLDVRGEKVRAGLIGPVHPGSIAAAVAAVLPLEPSLEDIALGLEAYSPLRGRMEVVRAGGLVIIDDTYNANPDSVASALAVLSRAGTGGRKVVVLGDMLELGDFAGAAHSEAGRLAAESGADIVAGVGRFAAEVAGGAAGAGLGPSRVLRMDDRAEALDTLREVLREGDLVLIKGSRGAGLDELVDGLRSEDTGKRAPGEKGLGGVAL